MTAPRKRKAPEKKPVRRPQGLVVRGTLAAGNYVAANPSFFGGFLAFGIIFSFVAANALWYQPRSHPHPIMNTRDAFRGFEQKQESAADTSGVTTFKIERQGTDIDNAPAVESTDVASQQVIAPSGPKAASFPDAPPSSETVLQIQQQLANLGFYDGTVDGQMGVKTQTAIQFYQSKNGMTIDGQPSGGLLNALRVSNGLAAIVPLERPSGDVTTNSTHVDPVAAAIAEAETAHPVVAPVYPPKSIPAQKAVATKPAATNQPVPKKIATQKADAQSKPVAKPAQKVAAKDSGGLDIASIITGDKAATKNPPPVKVSAPAKPVASTAAKPVTAPKQSAASGDAANAKATAKVLRIQKALTKFAYANVPQNGVAGPETKAAIRNFEKNYGLPVTGEPSDALLKKMKDVGVL